MSDSTLFDASRSDSTEDTSAWARPSGPATCSSCGTEASTCARWRWGCRAAGGLSCIPQIGGSKINGARDPSNLVGVYDWQGGGGGIKPLAS